MNTFTTMTLILGEDSAIPLKQADVRVLGLPNSSAPLDERRVSLFALWTEESQGHGNETKKSWRFGRD